MRSLLSLHFTDRKLKVQEVKQLAQGYTDSESESCSSHPGLSDSKAHILKHRAVQEGKDATKQ